MHAHEITKIKEQSSYLTWKRKVRYERLIYEYSCTCTKEYRHKGPLLCAPALAIVLILLSNIPSPVSKHNKNSTRQTIVICN